MIIDDIRQDFYNVLLGNRVLLLVHYDVDAICTCKILQGLFKSDNISYTLVPVGGISELKTAYGENCEEIKYVVLINCGGTIDLVDILQPEEDVVFFVLDSHKPTDVCNVYSDGQVRLVYRDTEENIPNFDDIFRDDEDEEEEEPVESGREGLEAAVEKRRARRAWEEKRHTLMFNYTQFSYYGKPSACVILELAWRVSRMGVAPLWAGGVSAAASRALHQRAPPQAALDAGSLTTYVASSQRNDDTAAKVVLEKDAWLPLYRVWSLESALRHSPVLGPHLKMHTLAGAGRLMHLLADMGYPLQQARQAFRSMDVSLRRGLAAALEAAGARLQLPAAAAAAFLLQRPHAHAAAALDVAMAVLGLIEHETMPKAEGFQHALSALDIESGTNESRRLGTVSAKKTLEMVVRLVNSTLSSRNLLLAGPFSYFIVQAGTPEAAFVRGPHWLGFAARWAATAGGGRALVASAPLTADTCILLGVPPKYDHEPRNLFGAAFEQAAAKSGTSVCLDYVDTSIITLPTSQRTQFLDALTALLA